MTTVTYRRGQELPGLTFPWLDSTGANLPLDTGYTFVLQLIANVSGVDAAPAVTITGASGSVGVAWAANALDITPGAYTLWLTATETATGKARVFSPARPPTLLIV